VNATKYYLDAVAPDGSGLIGYAMRLEAWGAKVTPAAVLAWHADPAVPVVQRRTLRGRLPVSDGAALAWDCAALGISGRWEAANPGPQATLYPGVDWRVLAAPAAVDARLAGLHLAGSGYAERLELHTAPWMLPLDTLLWGRFVAPGHAVVWIEWLHPQGGRWLWCDGSRTAAEVVSGSGIAWHGGRVRFADARVLRSGRLGDTVLRKWPGLRALVPARLAAYHESKWLAPAVLERDGLPPVRGWALHERVDCS
jgi:hypothetical protein